MGTTFFPRELTNARAIVGRRVAVTVPVRYPDDIHETAISSALARSRQKLQALVAGGTTVLDVFDGGGGADLTVTGSLTSPWTATMRLRSAAWNAVQAGAAELGFEWEGFGPEDVSLQDLDAPPEERTIYGPGTGFFDTTGEMNPDGTMNVKAVLEHGSREGLENFGEAVGTALKGTVSSVSTGLFKGLGTGGTIVLLLVLALVALLALVYVFGPAFFLGVAGGA